MCFQDPTLARRGRHSAVLGARARQAHAIAYARTFHAMKSRDRRRHRAIGVRHALLGALTGVTLSWAESALSASTPRSPERAHNGATCGAFERTLRHVP
jgi:hypothetical protein